MTKKGKRSLDGHIFKTVLITRLTILLLQYLSNELFRQHNSSDAFKSAILQQNATTATNSSIFRAFRGLYSWDSQYFLHISQVAYNEEKFLAFYPLYPIILHVLAPLQYLPIAFVLFNCLLHYLTARTLYTLTRLLYGNNEFAAKVAILFLWNPASIFFMAAYSESLYAFLSFSTMLLCLQLTTLDAITTLKAFFTLGLSTIARSNALLNFGYLVYFAFLKRLSIFKTVTVCLICAIPVAAYHYYAYTQFCTSSVRPTAVSDWCHQLVPNFYSFIQQRYWNVGFLAYYQTKQIGNFLLAVPVFVLIGYYCRYCFSFKKRNWPLLFPFLLHGSFLALFNICFVHIQVSTRMLFSASPLPLWASATILANCKFSDSFYPFHILCSKSKISEKLLISYYLLYFFIGTILFALFLPWT